MNQVAENRAITRALNILESRIAYDPTALEFSSPDDSQAYFRLKLGEKKREVFSCLFLNAASRFLAYEELFAGTVDSASVYPRVIAAKALELNAVSVILAHNHPSGGSEPSRADIDITLKIRDALGLFDIRTLDHIIVGARGCVSLAEEGQI